MNDILISIIIPVYNYQKYLKKCIDSVVNQTYKNIEIIIVDDGSTDGCTDIIKEYEKKDKRIKAYYKNNEGIGYALKDAFKLMTGDYVAFLDADDSLNVNSFLMLTEELQKNAPDILEFGRINIDINGNKRSESKRIPNIFKGNDLVMKEFLYGDRDTTIATKIVKKKLLYDIDIPKESIGIDEIISTQLMLKGNTYQVVNMNLYYVLNGYGKDSISRSDLKGENILKHIGVYHFIFNKLMQINSKYIGDYYLIYLKNIIVMYAIICDYKKKDYIENKKVLLNEYKKYYKLFKETDIFLKSKLSIKLLFSTFIKLRLIYVYIITLRPSYIKEHKKDNHQINPNVGD